MRDVSRDFPFGKKLRTDRDPDFAFGLERGGRFAGFSVRKKLDEKLVWDFPFGKKLRTDRDPDFAFGLERGGRRAGFSVRETSSEPIKL